MQLQNIRSNSLPFTLIMINYLVKVIMFFIIVSSFHLNFKILSIAFF